MHFICLHLFHTTRFARIYCKSPPTCVYRPPSRAVSLCASAWHRLVLPVPGGPCSSTTLRCKERSNKVSRKESRLSRSRHYYVSSSSGQRLISTVQLRHAAGRRP